MTSKTNRRLFVKASVFTGLTLAANAAFSLPGSDKGCKEKKMTILFQGDSITDGNRGRTTDPNHILGHGYAFAVAARIGADFPECGHVFYNRGISGNRIADLEKRWQKDTLDIKPDLLSILIGINDAAALVKQSSAVEPDIALFSNTYRNLLLQCKQQNPQMQFVLCLPFVYPAGKMKDSWQKYDEIVKQLVGQINILAAEFNAVVVDFSKAFEKAFRKAPVDYWIWDGIHPTVPGHEIMARVWTAQVSSRLKFLKMYRHL